MFKKPFIIPSLALLCVIELLINGPIPQDQNYHNFADQRKLWNIPNFLNVITNLPFLIVGLLCFQAFKNNNEKELKYILFALFTGFILLTFGSSYYHLWPGNDTLVYDRIPIVIIIMSFFGYLIYNCIDKRTGYKAFIISNIVGVMTVIYWAYTEHIGKGDLRWYGMVQFFPIVAIPLILILYKSAKKTWKEVISIFLFFGLAKLCEHFDRDVYYFLSSTISGHSFKHLFMAVACYKIVVMINDRSTEAFGK